MSSKICPNCNLWNSESAIVCDCGYRFINHEFINKETKDNYELLSIIIAILSTLLLIILIIAFINIELRTTYHPEHIFEEKQHTRIPLMLILGIIPFLSIGGIIIGNKNKHRKSIEYKIAIIGRILNTTILLSVLLLFIIEIYLSINQ